LEPQDVVGTWKLLSGVRQVAGSDRVVDNLGAHPNGVMIITPEYRFIVIFTAADGRKPAATTEDLPLYGDFDISVRTNQLEVRSGSSRAFCSTATIHDQFESLTDVDRDVRHVRFVTKSPNGTCSCQYHADCGDREWRGLAWHGMRPLHYWCPKLYD
jgi:hypothetical protein